MENIHLQSGGSSPRDGERTGSATGEGSGSGEEAGETQDEESSSSLELALDHFRLQWQRELESSPLRDGVVLSTSKSSDICGKERPDLSLSNDTDVKTEEQARHLFLCGVHAEQTGKLYEAIAFYRRAVQLVPDIEFRISDCTARPVADAETEESDAESIVDVDYIEEEEEIENLVERFQRFSTRTGNTQICLPEHSQKATHISVLPTEVFIHILKWVVSGELDLYSLEQVGQACRGFYMCARDPEIWRLACLRVWGVNCGSVNKYGSWREMFLSRPRLCFNGAYISKTTYVRYGELSFQDTNYRPCYLVEYFRYLRFFPEGYVLMMTTPDDPYQALSKLRYRKSRHPNILCGHYRLVGNTVTAVVKRPKTDNLGNNGYYRYRKQVQPQEASEQNFHVELEVCTVKGRRNFQLAWRRYSIHVVYRNGQETVSEFELTQANFPPFWFSRVRSFTAESESLLE